MPGPDNTPGGWGFLADRRTLTILAAGTVIAFVACFAAVYFAMR